MILIILVMSLFMNFILYPVCIRSDSMEPDVPQGSFVFTLPFLRKPARGDVVLVQNYETKRVSFSKTIVNNVCLFFTARQWKPFKSQPFATEKPHARRVIGMPGDTIYIDRYVVFIKTKDNAHFLTEFEVCKKKYNVEVLVPPASWDVELGAKSSVRTITLADDEYFVLADKRISSMDSRVWGTVKQSKIKGKLVMLYFPFNKFKFL